MGAAQTKAQNEYGSDIQGVDLIDLIDLLLKAASYTYGPLLGLFTFGIFTKQKIKDQWVWLIAIISVIITYCIGSIPPEYIGGYHFNYELLIVNGAITFIGLILIRRKQH